MKMAPRVQIHIDRLVLTGMDESEAQQVSHMLRHTLAQLLMQQPLCTGSLVSGEIQLEKLKVKSLPACHSSLALGTSAGRAVFRALKSELSMAQQRGVTDE